MRIFELGPGRKFRASTGQSGRLRLEIRTPNGSWGEVSAPDVLSSATNALALAAAGEPPAGFCFTNDPSYVDTAVRYENPFLRRNR